MTEAGSNCWKPFTQKKSREDVQEVTANLAKDTSVDVAGAAVLSELEGIFTLKKNKKQQ